MKLFRLSVFAAILFALSSAALGQKVPTFSQYKAAAEKKRVITVDLKSHKDARMFRTNLRNAAKGGVNFAGHYVLTGWGCGTNCSQWAIIDARNGRVYFPKQFAGVGFGFCELPENAMPKDAPKEDDDSAGPIYFKANSRLVVLTGFPGGGLDDDKVKCGNYFYEWNGTSLKQIKLIPGKRGDAP
jgi:hypothetical protein